MSEMHPVRLFLRVQPWCLAKVQQLFGLELGPELTGVRHFAQADVRLCLRRFPLSLKPGDSSPASKALPLMGFLVSANTSRLRTRSGGLTSYKASQAIVWRTWSLMVHYERSLTLFRFRPKCHIWSLIAPVSKPLLGCHRQMQFSQCSKVNRDRPRGKYWLAFGKERGSIRRSFSWGDVPPDLAYWLWRVGID